MFSIRNKVWILNTRNTDGRYCRGIVVGVELIYPCLGYRSEYDYFRDFVEYRYKVAYVDADTKRAYAEWVSPKDLSKNKPLDATN